MKTFKEFLNERSAPVTKSEKSNDITLLTKLEQAVYRQDEDEVKEALEQNANPNYITSVFQEPLIISAIAKGNLEIVKLFVENGYDLELKANDGTTALSQAIELKETDIALYLIEVGANVNEEGRVFSPLYYAVRTENFEVAQALVKKGADVDFINRAGNPLIVMAIYDNLMDFVDLFLPKADLTVKNKFDETPIEIMKKSARWEEYKKLLSKR